MAINDCGVIIGYETVEFDVEKRNSWNGKAHICVGEHDGLYYFSYGFTVGNGGQSYAPSIGNEYKKEPSFLTYDEAYQAAEKKLLVGLESAKSNNLYGTIGHEQAIKLINKIKTNRQGSLF